MDRVCYHCRFKGCMYKEEIRSTIYTYIILIMSSEGHQDMED